ncbi:uncharacterized protein LOC127254680 [Andrographis paniculata]|uniref:uncharacterized protein LOC127254680 n=1 Tax=Andrographis paniculata TaxID=175694 RepID=UPI0021E8ADE3|nr:uncharacterized protein LOC127254680 [Andrographis paniculata]
MRACVPIHQKYKTSSFQQFVVMNLDSFLLKVHSHCHVNLMRIPVRFAAEFDELSRVRPCQSSGSEHSADLSDLVNSFLEEEIGEQRRNEGVAIDDDGDLESNSEIESRASLEILFDCENDAVRRGVRAAVESEYIQLVAGGGNSSSSSPDFKRRLMHRLRSRGIDAGLCKSKSEKKGAHTHGRYEFVDVNAGDSRYVIELFLAGEFTIARPTDGYRALLDIFPQIYVGKAEELRQVVQLMCQAIKRSMAAVGILVPPWRRLAYMESKWFGSHQRTTNEISTRKGSKMNGPDLFDLERVRSGPSQAQAQGIILNCRHEFAARTPSQAQAQGNTLNCRHQFAARTHGRMGNLATVLN